ncbi:MAG: hypothetical protein EAX96_11085 [Candidatus Lokiarchaeota archaeon]|nr:hypothetical protein [Candidatus Lokiarchaeota archaeon]
MSKERKTLAVAKALAVKISESTKERGITLYNFLNQCMLQAIRAENELNTDLSNIIEKIESFELAKKLGFVLAPSNLFYSALSGVEDYIEEFQNKFYEFGKWMIRYCEAKYPSINERIDILIKFAKNAFWRDIEVKFRLNDDYTHQLNVIKKNMDFPDAFLNYYSQTFIAIFEHLGFKKTSQTFETSHINISFEPKTKELLNIIKMRMTEPSNFFEPGEDDHSIDRKTLAVDKEIAETLLEISKKRNMTLFNYVNEHVLKNCISIEENFDQSIEDIVSEYVLFQVVKEIDMILVPASIYFECVKIKLFKDKNWVNKWYEEGVKDANLVKIQFSSFPVEEYKSLLNYVYFADITGFKIELTEDSEELNFRLIGTMIDEDLMGCLARYYEGLFNVYGWTLDEDKKIVSLGVCSLKFAKPDTSKK